MPFTYILFLLTFLGFPVLGREISRFLILEKSKKYLVGILVVFALHNILYFLGISIKGDYPDYIIFSLEYLFLCITTFLLNQSKNLYAVVFRGIGTFIQIIFFLKGLIGILFFIVLSQELEADRLYKFNSNKKNYQTRRYSFGFATSYSTTYNFETYRTYKYLPFENKIDKTKFIDTKTDLDFMYPNFRVSIENQGTDRILKFSSSKGKKYTKIIK